MKIFFFFNKSLIGYDLVFLEGNLFEGEGFANGHGWEKIEVTYLVRNFKILASEKKKLITTAREKDYFRLKGNLTKSDVREAGVRVMNREYDYRRKLDDTKCGLVLLPINHAGNSPFYDLFQISVF